MIKLTKDYKTTTGYVNTVKVGNVKYTVGTKLILSLTKDGSYEIELK